MNTDVKKSFMIANFPNIEVIKGDCLLEATGENGSVEKVADILVDAYKDIFSDKNQLVLFMGHGNPDENYSANEKYIDIEDAMKSRLSNDNVIVGTVDYGPTVFWPWESVSYPEDKDEVLVDPVYNNCVYAEVVNYCDAKGIALSDLKITLVPFMTVAGDHAHNDLWGVGEIASEVNSDPDGDASWRLILETMGCQINDYQSHGSDAASCEIVGLCDYQSIRNIWIDRLSALIADPDSWENGSGYQLEE